MRVLLMNSRYSQVGGTEIQVQREKDLLEAHGHQVLLVTLEPDLPAGWVDKEKSHYNFPVQYDCPVSGGIHVLAVNRPLTDAIKGRIERFGPDCIHLNQTIPHSPSMLTAIKEAGFPCLQTVRDYAIVCPTGYCSDRRDRVCPGVSQGDCLRQCMPANTKKMAEFLVKYLHQKRTAQLRMEAVTYFACPSRMLTSYCNRHGFPTACLNNPFDFTLLEQFQKNVQREPMLFLCYGAISRFKGIDHLARAFAEFSKERNVLLYFAGEIWDDYQSDFATHTRHPKIEYLGKLPYPEMLRLLERVHTVVAPALWMENYPNTVLEGIAAKCIVLSSDRGGGRELIRDDRFIFDVLNQEDIVAKLETAWALSEGEREDITQRAYRRVRENNDPEVFYTRLIPLLERCAQEGTAAQPEWGGVPVTGA